MRNDLLLSHGVASQKKKKNSVFLIFIYFSLFIKTKKNKTKNEFLLLNTNPKLLSSIQKLEPWKLFFKTPYFIFYFLHGGKHSKNVTWRFLLLDYSGLQKMCGYTLLLFTIYWLCYLSKIMLGSFVDVDSWYRLLFTSIIYLPE